MLPLLVNALSFLFFFSSFLVIADADRDKLAQSNGKFAHYLCKILDVYFSYHRESYGTNGMLLIQS